MERLYGKPLQTLFRHLLISPVPYVNLSQLETLIVEAFANQLPLSELQAHIMGDPDASGRGSVKEATWGYRASRMSDENRKAHIHRGYSDIVTFNEVIRDVERRMNVGEHDESGETMQAAPFPEGRDISAHAPHPFQMNRRHCEDKIVDATALGFTHQDTISYLHMSKYEGRMSLQNIMILKLATGMSVDELAEWLRLKRIEIKIYEKYQPRVIRMRTETLSGCIDCVKSKLGADVTGEL